MPKKTKQDSDDVKLTAIEAAIEELPEGWEKVRLSQVASVNYGKAKPKEEGTIPVVGSGGIYAYTNQSLVTYSSLVIGRKGSAGQVWLLEKPFWPSDTTFYLDWESSIDCRFLYCYFFFRPISGQHAKTTLPSVLKPDLENFLIPLPPLPEQKNISAVLSALQDTIAQTEAVIESLRNLKKTMMRHLFTYGPVAMEEMEQAKLKETEIGMMPEEWEVVKLGEISTISTGTTPSTEVEEYYNGDIPFVKTSEITNSMIRKTITYVTQKAVDSYNLKLYPAQTVFMAMYGQGKTRGQVSLLQIPATTSQNTAAIVAHNSLYPEFLYTYLMSRYDNLRKDGIQGHISHLNLGYVKKFLIPLPPLPIQQKIAEILSSLDAKIQAEESKKKSLDTLFKTLLELLMTGKIRITSLEQPL